MIKTGYVLVNSKEDRSIIGKLKQIEQCDRGVVATGNYLSYSGLDIGNYIDYDIKDVLTKLTTSPTSEYYDGVFYVFIEMETTTICVIKEYTGKEFVKLFTQKGCGLAEIPRLEIKNVKAGVVKYKQEESNTPKREKFNGLEIKNVKAGVVKYKQEESNMPEYDKEKYLAAQEKYLDRLRKNLVHDKCRVITNSEGEARSDKNISVKVKDALSSSVYIDLSARLICSDEVFYFAGLYISKNRILNSIKKETVNSISKYTFYTENGYRVLTIENCGNRLSLFDYKSELVSRTSKYFSEMYVMIDEYLEKYDEKKVKDTVELLYLYAK